MRRLFTLKNLLILIIAIPLVYSIGLYIVRKEKVTNPDFPKEFVDAEQYCKTKEVKVLRFAPKEVGELQTALNSLEECTTIELGRGTFVLNNSVSISGVKGITLKGEGKKNSIIKFENAGNVNGVDVEASNHFTIRDLSIQDSPKNGLEVRLSENIRIDSILVTWSARSGEAMMKNGAYGVYPVNVINVLLQNTETYYASDAGLYVGQCINAVVRNNLAEFNVMGLEIENTVNADVYDNIVRNNTGGFLSYDLNKNTIVSRNIRVHRNKIINNNNPNFSSAGIVRSVPAGVGMILTSIRDIEIFDNEFANNNSLDIAILNGLVSETPDFSEWPMNNWRAYNIHIHGNIFKGGSGTNIDNGNHDVKLRPLGYLMHLVHEEFNRYLRKEGKSAIPVPNIVYDGVDEGYTILVMTTWFGNNPGNRNRICLKNNGKGGMHPNLFDFNLPALLNNSDDPTDETIRTAVEKGDVRLYSFDESNPYNGAPTAGFDCEGYRATDVPVKFPDL